jgi:hypothetical protein
MMVRNRNPNIIMCDVDCTLIEPFDITKHEPGQMLDITTPWGTEHFVELKHVTRRLRRQHMQGHYVIVWSQGGDEWTEIVVKALKLQDCVDQIMTKPKWYFDDLPADEWMKRTIP